MRRTALFELRGIWQATSVALRGSGEICMHPEQLERMRTHADASELRYLITSSYFTT